MRDLATDQAWQKTVDRTPELFEKYPECVYDTKDLEPLKEGFECVYMTKEVQAP